MERGKNIAHDMVIESLIEALLQLMEKVPFSKIKISELCDRAGVSRISFYRNYKSMEEILLQHLIHCTDVWWANFSKKDAEDFFETFWVELLDQYKENEKLINLMYSNNLSHIIKEHIFSCCGPENGLDIVDSYSRALLAGAIYGLVDEWIRRGMEDFPRDFNFRKVTSQIAERI